MRDINSKPDPDSETIPYVLAHCATELRLRKIHCGNTRKICFSVLFAQLLANHTKMVTAFRSFFDSGSIIEYYHSIIFAFHVFALASQKNKSLDPLRPGSCKMNLITIRFFHAETTHNVY